MSLADLGWNSALADALASLNLPDVVPARVMKDGGGLLHVNSGEEEWIADIAGRLRHRATSKIDIPTVGDWVAVEPRSGEGRATIVAVLPRRTCFLRKKKGEETDAQVVAANIDMVFVVCALDGGRSFNVRGIQRYLTLAKESGADIGLILNKVDLCEDLPAALQVANSISHGLPIYEVSALTGEAMDVLRADLEPGRTYALIGMSGVGKSMLINRLVGNENLATGEVRESDRRGRHTTTAREIVRLPSGGWVVDTPGMRELQLWADADSVDETFADILELAEKCRFRDCRHEAEPGCAVRLAIEESRLEPARYEHFLKLRGEVAYLLRRQNQRLLNEEKRRVKVMHNTLNDRLKEKRGEG